jgi:phosphohistidine phosphatase SixA
VRLAERQAAPYIAGMKLFSTLLAAGLAALFSALPPAKAAEPVPAAALAAPGHVLLLRHAIAPGTGDPAGMRLGDCSTQRNLDAAGRAQAQAIGAALRLAGIGQARVFASQWCRTRETAEILALGPVVERPAELNSFFDARAAQPAATAALRAFLRDLPADGGLVVLVTHQVNITALTSIVPASGEGVVLRLAAGGEFAVAGRLPPPPL